MRHAGVCPHSVLPACGRCRVCPSCVTSDRSVRRLCARRTSVPACQRSPTTGASRCPTSRRRPPTSSACASRGTRGIPVSCWPQSICASILIIIIIYVLFQLRAKIKNHEHKIKYHVGDTKQRLYNFPSCPCAEIFKMASHEPIMQSIIDCIGQTNDCL